MTLTQPTEFIFEGKPIKVLCCPVCNKEIDLTHTQTFSGIYCPKCGYCRMDVSTKPN